MGLLLLQSWLGQQTADTASDQGAQGPEPLRRLLGTAEQDASEVQDITARLALLELKALAVEDPLGMFDNWQPDVPTCGFKRVRTELAACCMLHAACCPGRQLQADHCSQVRCDKAGRVVNITLTSPDHLMSQYAELQALSHGDSSRLAFQNEIDPDNPADWEAVSKFQKHWPDWHYQTPQLQLSSLPASDNFLQLGRDSLRGLHLDNTRWRLCQQAQLPQSGTADSSTLCRLQNGVLPDSWGVMTSLKQISLSACGLAGTVPESWASLQALEYVNLGDNPDLEGPLPAAWGGLRRLQYLDLSLLGVVRFAGTEPCKRFNIATYT